MAAAVRGLSGGIHTIGFRFFLLDSFFPRGFESLVSGGIRSIRLTAWDLHSLGLNGAELLKRLIG